MVWLAIIHLCGNPSSLESIATRYFEHYATRSDFAGFMSYYAENAILEDLVYGDRKVGRDAIRRFFDWGNSDFDGHSPNLKVESMVIQGQQAVARGYFNSFSFKGQKMGPWYFVIWLEFDAQNKIKHQIDFINYDNDLLVHRKDANQWIQLDTP